MHPFKISGKEGILFGGIKILILLIIAPVLYLLNCPAKMIFFFQIKGLQNRMSPDFMSFLASRRGLS